MGDKDVKDLPIRNKRNDKGLFLVPPPYSTCKHYGDRFELDEDAGKAKCLDCNQEVSLMFVLKRLMRQESKWMRSRERYMDEMKRLSDRRRTKCQHCGNMTQISSNKPHH